MDRTGDDAAVRTYKPGEVIFQQGDAGAGEAYLIHEGTVLVRTLTDGTERLLRTLVKGDLLGEVALFRHGPFSYRCGRRTRDPSPRTGWSILFERVLIWQSLIEQLARMAAGDDKQTRQ